MTSRSLSTLVLFLIRPVIDFVVQLDFTGFSLTNIVLTYVNLNTNATVTVTTTTTTTAASQAAAAAATIGTTLHAVFDARNLPADVCERYDTFNSPAYIFAQKAMVPFASLQVVVVQFYLILTHLLVME